MKKFYYILFLLLPLLAMVGCTDESLYDGEGDQVTLSYSVKLDDEAKSRAIGDGSNVDQLLVGIFKKNGEQFVQLAQEEFPVSENKANVTLQLLKNQEYQLVFWAQKKGNGIYDTSDLSNITIDYSNFQKTQAEAAQLDAFYATSKVTVTTSTSDGGSITLKRPFTQFGIGVYGSDVEVESIESAQIKVIGTLYTGFKPLAEGEKADAGNANEYTFNFTELTELNDKSNSFIINDKTYTLLTTNYFLVPTEKTDATISGSVSLKDGNGDSVSEFQFTDAPLVLNARLNLGKGLTEVWDGVIVEALPEADGNGIIHIENTQQLAYLMKYGVTGTVESPKKIHLCKDLDMNGTVIPRAADYAIQHVSFDGGGKTLYRLGTSLFGKASNVDITGLNIQGANITDDGHVGVLADTLCGNSTLQDITINSSSALSNNGAAGGMVGYIVRKSEKDRSETLTVTFNNCDLVGVTANGSLSEGKFVGLLSGYDNGETLTFDADCSADANTDVTDFTSPYMVENQSVWAKKDANGNDIIIDAKYNGWLGTETYRRGKVTFEGKRLVPKWDGNTTVTPLVENNVNLIYSPYDIAYYQGKSSTSVTFKEDVDLGSQIFDPIWSITNLDGENHTVYNLKVDMVHDGTGAAFIQSASGNTTHKNITFVGADIKNVNNPELLAPNYGVTSDGGAGNAYAGTLVSHSGGTYTVTNVHVKNSKVYAICKMGGLVGYVGGNLEMSQCSVEDCIIENFEPIDKNGKKIPNYYTLPRIYELSLSNVQSLSGITSLFQVGKIPNTATVNCLQWWYTNGECGGLIGFIKSKSAKIDACKVLNTEINCVGQPNKTVVANVWDKADFDTNNPYVSGKKIFAKGNTDIAGRHVNQFIGDIVSERKEGGNDYNVTISNYEVRGNTYFDSDASSATQYCHNYASGKYCEVVGCAYYIGVDVKMFNIDLTHVNDCAGSLTFYPLNGTSVTLTEEVKKGNDMSWVGGSFTDAEYKQKRSGPLFRPSWSYNVESYYPTYP